jgi:hypothetical protein
MVSMTLDALVQQLQAVYGTDLRSVVLYGSAAAGTRLAKRSDVNVLVIVSGLTMQQLAAASATSVAWSEAGNPPPLTMTEREWRSSHDIFPMEYADILERHQVLYGAPPFEGIGVDTSHMRLQLEREAMGKLLRLRNSIMAAGSDRKRHAELIGASVSTIMVLFRAMTRLYGERPESGYEALCAQAERLTSGEVPAQPFVRAVRHAGGQETLQGGAVDDALANYLAGVEALVQHLDRFAPNG